MFVCLFVCSLGICEWNIHRTVVITPITAQNIDFVKENEGNMTNLFWEEHLVDDVHDPI